MSYKNPSALSTLTSFDLGEAGGGEQVIIDYREISSTEYYVMTLGNGPKIKLDGNSNIEDLKNEYEKTKGSEQLQKTSDNFQEKNKSKGDVKLRFFKLTFSEGNRYRVEEFINPQMICNIARLFK